MASEGEALRITLPAGADLTGNQYKFVKVDASGKAIAIAAATDLPVGVLQNEPSVVDDAAEIIWCGKTKIEADAALNEGDLIGTSADGQADAKVVVTDIAEYTVGQMLTAVGAAAEVGVALICCIPNRSA